MIQREGRSNGVIYDKALFELQLQFAERVSVLSGLPLARTVLEYTNFYMRFGLGRDFDLCQGWIGRGP